MDYRKYRACLVGVIAIALACGVLLFIRLQKENQIPADGTLVENQHETTIEEPGIRIQSRDGMEIWA